MPKLHLHLLQNRVWSSRLLPSPLSFCLASLFYSLLLGPSPCFLQLLCSVTIFFFFFNSLKEAFSGLFNPPLPAFTFPSAALLANSLERESVSLSGKWPQQSWAGLALFAAGQGPGATTALGVDQGSLHSLLRPHWEQTHLCATPELLTGSELGGEKVQWSLQKPLQSQKL